MAILETDLQVIVKGINDEETGNTFGEAIAGVVQGLVQLDETLDFRRLHKIIVTTDFAGELADISKQNPSLNTITYTKEEYGEAGAIVLLLPHSEGIEVVPVVNANCISGLLSENRSLDFHPFRYAVHLLHHELSHVHDNNKKLDVFKDSIMKVSYRGKDMYIRPMTEACWSEYFANRMSSSSANEELIRETIETFTTAIRRTKPFIDNEIRTYRRSGDLDHIISILQRHGDFLLKSAAYVLGYVDGTGKGLSELCPESASYVEGSYFATTLGAMQKVLRSMFMLYPSEWKGLDAYDELAEVIEEYYDVMGFQISNTETGVYITIPIRPETE